MLSRLSVTTIGDRHRLRALVPTLKTNISLRLQLLLVNAWLFSADEAVLVEGVAVVVKENLLREGLGEQVLFV